MARMDVIDKRVDKLGSAFGHYVQVHDEQVPFTGEQLAAHRTCIAPRWRAGSVGDVLEDKSSRGPLDHLGPLSAVWLYRNDRQIKEVSYREIESEQAGYTVTIRVLT